MNVIVTGKQPSLQWLSVADADFDALFMRDRLIIFAFRGYPWLIQCLTCRRSNHANLDVWGYKEEGTTKPLDMMVLNEIDCFDLVGDVVDRYLA